jgi:hypothetical protein
VGFMMPILSVAIAIIVIAWTAYTFWNRPGRH